MSLVDLPWMVVVLVEAAAAVATAAAETAEAVVVMLLCFDSVVEVKEEALLKGEFVLILSTTPLTAFLLFRRNFFCTLPL